MGVAVLGLSVFIKWCPWPQTFYDVKDIKNISTGHIKIPDIGVDTAIDGQKIYHTIDYLLDWGVSWGALCTFAGLFGQIAFCCRSSAAMLFLVLVSLALTGIDGFFLHRYRQVSSAIAEFDEYDMEEVKSELTNKYYDDSDVKSIMDLMQNHLKCCGFDGYQDWHGRVPDSCSKDGYRSRPGCNDKISRIYDEVNDFLDIGLGVIAAILGAHALLALLGVALIYLFLRKSESSS